MIISLQCNALVENLWYLAVMWMLKNLPKHCYGQSKPPNSTGLPHGSVPPSSSSINSVTPHKRLRNGGICAVMKSSRGSQNSPIPTPTRHAWASPTHTTQMSHMSILQKANAKTDPWWSLHGSGTSHWFSVNVDARSTLQHCSFLSPSEQLLSSFLVSSGCARTMVCKLSLQGLFGVDVKWHRH